MQSFVAIYHSTDGHPLLGGKLTGGSSRWHVREDAEAYLANVKELNGPRCDGGIVTSDKYPEILRHCPGHPAQAIGGRCFGCGKVLTLEDAKRAGSGKPPADQETA